MHLSPGARGSLRIRREDYLNKSIPCPWCPGLLFNHLASEFVKCDHCTRNFIHKEILHCNVCDLNICKKCLEECFQKRKENFKIETQPSWRHIFNWIYTNPIIIFTICICILLCVILPLFFNVPNIIALIGNLSSRQTSVKLLTVDELRLHFPSQKNETWNHVLSVMNTKYPTVKSLTLLYSKDDKTKECLVSKLIKMYTKDDSIKIENVSYKNIKKEVKDYGEVLQYYFPIVEKHRVFITDLSNLPGNIARIFHSLCDEVSSPIKPSLFIFTLRFNNSWEHLKPSKRATTLLQKAWHDLPTNELFPLLSRVVKNVIDVIPEKQIKC